VKDRTLPRVVMPLTREETIILATTRRGEVIQAAIATDVFRLEICAQGAIRFRPATRTFAMGADIHAKATPLGNRGSEYRPDAIGLEMPPAFAGKKEDRMDKATALSMRADAVYAKTVNLITLEAENSYLLWEEVQRKLVPSEMGYKAAASYRKRSEDDPDTPRSEDLVVGEVLVAQAFSGYNDVLYQAILAIVSLERVTGGGYRADFTHVPPPEEKNGNGKNGNGEEKKDDKDEKKNDK